MDPLSIRMLSHLLPSLPMVCLGTLLANDVGMRQGIAEGRLQVGAHAISHVDMFKSKGLARGVCIRLGIAH